MSAETEAAQAAVNRAYRELHDAADDLHFANARHRAAKFAVSDANRALEYALIRSVPCPICHACGDEHCIDTGTAFHTARVAAAPACRRHCGGDPHDPRPPHRRTPRPPRRPRRPRPHRLPRRTHHTRASRPRADTLRQLPRAAAMRRAHGRRCVRQVPTSGGAVMLSFTVHGLPRSGRQQAPCRARRHGRVIQARQALAARRRRSRAQSHRGRPHVRDVHRTRRSQHRLLLR